MNTFVWIDLGVKDLKRAVNFYQNVLARVLMIESFEGYEFAVFSHEGNDVSGCLVPQADFQPLPMSTLVYFNVSGRMKEAVEAVETNGGKIIKEPHSIGPHGERAIILDSEGNHIALHSS